MRYFILLLLIYSTAFATTITLTPAQIDKVVAENPVDCPVCPDPIDPPIDPIPPTPTTCEDNSTLQGSAKAWTAVFYQSFPGPTYENVTNIVIPQRGFWSVAFNTGSAVDNGKLSLLENAASPGIRKGSISKCPGDFSAAPECSYSWGLGGGIEWATDGKAGACQLKRGTLYYFNVTYTNGVNPASSRCGATPCRINLQHYNF